MFRQSVLLVVGLVSMCSVAAVDERALKLSEPHTPATVLQPRNSVSYSGTNVGAPEWVRPFADGTCCSGLGPVRYQAQDFFLSANDTCDLGSVQDGGWDGYLFVYSSPFDPLNQTVNFVAADDDGNGGIGTSDIMGLALTGGTIYTLVTTGFEIGEEGTFTNTVNCPTATVTLGGIQVAPSRPVPMLGPSTLALLGLLMLAIGVFVAQRSRAA